MKKMFLALMAFGVSATAYAQQAAISHFREYSQDGINKFEQSKVDSLPFDGLKVRLGAGFAQQFQRIHHKTNPNFSDKLQKIGPGFNNATANLNIDAQLAPGMRLNLVTYLSSRHHQEAWVKGGFLQIDQSPIDWQPLHQLFNYITIKAGHYEINYGDAHFRRSDNGQVIYNPFVGNNIMDAFTTEIGGEVNASMNGFLGVIAVTGGEIRGNIMTENGKRNPSFIGKLGYDNQLTKDLRTRITGSVYLNEGTQSNTLYSGDRAGARYYNVLTEEGTASDADASSGNFNPGFSHRVSAFMINPFVKYKGLEFFSTLEFSKGRSRTETESRKANQFAADLVYRFGPRENYYVGARYNKVKADQRFSLPSTGSENKTVEVERMQWALGWFITKNILLKGEYVVQKYKDYPDYTKFHEGKFDGFMVEAAISF